MNPLLWLRRDLRIHDNPALVAALKVGASSAVFISAPKQWQQHNLAPIQADFIRRHLLLVAKQLAEYGIELHHLKASDYHSQTQVLKDFCHKNDIDTVYANREPEINELNRDALFQNTGIQLALYSCDTILPVGSVLNKQNEMYKVFTPFKKAWLQRLQSTGVECAITPVTKVKVREPTSLFSLEFDYPKVDSSRWPLSDEVMKTVVPAFFENKLDRYGGNRDFPAIKATSGLSPYLAIGAISSRWLALQLVQRQPDIVYDPSMPGFAWFNELIWRDFYKHLLFTFPALATGQSFQRKYRNMDWQGNPEHFQAWCEGRTGYPLVDAAMKQLVQTGWMHNRLRMVVASFLTKHLLIDWRRGEQFFMSHLIDGDLSANNGGWQWAASTGCDAQPYFRVFNPITQSKRFDPNGDFIRRYLPELHDVPAKHVHFPHEYLESLGDKTTYCSPIVDHKEARQRALDFFKQY